MQGIDFPIDHVGEEATTDNQDNATQDPAASGDQAKTGDGAGAEGAEQGGEEAEVEPHVYRGQTKAIQAARDEARAAKDAVRDLQQQLARTQGRIEGMQGGEAPKGKPPHEEEDNEFFDSSPSTSVRKLGTKQRDEQFADRMAQTGARAVKVHDDFGEMVTKYSQRAEADSDVFADIRHAHDPAEFFYKWAKTQDARDQLKGKSLEEVEAALRAKIMGELKQKQAVETSEETPTSRAGARGSGRGVDASASTRAEGDDPMKGVGGMDQYS